MLPAACFFLLTALPTEALGADASGSDVLDAESLSAETFAKFPQVRFRIDNKSLYRLDTEWKTASTFALPHGPDNPLNDPTGESKVGPLLFIGLATLAAGAIFTGLALDKTKKMEEATTRTELTKHFEQQKVYGTLAYSLLGGGAVLIVLHIALPAD